MTHRIDVLDCLADDPADKRALVDDLDVSRSTIDRGIRDLEIHGLVERCEEGYAITTKGGVLRERFADFRETSALTTYLEPFLQWVPDEEFDLPVESLLDASITVATTGDPYAPVNRHQSALGTAEEVTALLSAVGLKPLETARDRLVAGEGRHEIVVDPSVAETIRSKPEYSTLLEDMRGTDRLDLYVSADAIPFYVGVLDDVLQVGVEDGAGLPRALIETDDAGAVEWARRTFREYRDRSRTLV